MFMEELLLIGLAVIYSLISYGHSPRESGRGRLSEKNQRSRHLTGGEVTPSPDWNEARSF
jgi:hypothetical protein